MNGSGASKPLLGEAAENVLPGSNPGGGKNGSQIARAPLEAASPGDGLSGAKVYNEGGSCSQHLASGTESGSASAPDSLSLDSSSTLHSAAASSSGASGQVSRAAR